MEVVAPTLTADPIHVDAGSGEDPLPRHSRPAFGYFLAKAPGNSIQPPPWRKSAACCARTTSRARPQRS
jgi:hypothetical protein